MNRPTVVMQTQSTCRIQSANVLVTASYGHYGRRAARIGPDRLYQIRLSTSDLVPFFEIRHLYHTVQIRPGFRSGWSGEGLAERIITVWKQARIIGHLFLAGRNRPATNFPFSDSVAFFDRRLGSNCAKPARLRFSSAVIIRPASGQRFWAHPHRMRIGSGMFTGKVDIFHVDSVQGNSSFAVLIMPWRLTQLPPRLAQLRNVLAINN